MSCLLVVTSGLIFRLVGNRYMYKRMVLVLQSGYHIAFKSLRDVSTFDVKIKQPNGLV